MVKVKQPFKKKQLQKGNRGPVSIEDYYSAFYWSIEEY
ncbi:hypothetical protein IGJ83_002599 [Enterococcus pernyi]